MKNTMIILVIAFILAGCSSQNSENNLYPELRKVKIEEVINGKYTYVRVSESDAEYWLATENDKLKEGEIFYFGNFMVMQNFKSKELDRIFNEIYFVDEMSQNPEELIVNKTDNAANPHGDMGSQHGDMGSHHSDMTSDKKTLAKSEVSVEKAEGGITIAELYESKDNYNGTKVLIRGQVVKVNNDIMNKNWIHIQDGTDNNGKFDLTVTTKEKINVGDVVIFEGTITLDKDFGAGYKYEIIMEDAVLK